MNKDMLTESYNYNLPREMIAGRPVKGRDGSKLLVYKKNDDSITHAHFRDLSKFLEEETKLILNRTKVFNSRLICKKATGGKAEIFFLSTNKLDGLFKVLIKTSRKKRIGDRFIFTDDTGGEIKKDFLDGTFGITVDTDDLEVFLRIYGSVPIPPYIRNGESDILDVSDYQTVYAKNIGSVAAPTAGLHFTDKVFKSLEKKKIERVFVTLHVGMGTFFPVKAEKIEDHNMHYEDYLIEKLELEKLNHSKKRIAVGTTSLRVLESCYNGESFDINPDKIYSTNIFLHPGVEVKSISGLITNFHLPKSSLLMLVSSLIGREKTMALYEEAKREKYRFYSYGDAMLILL